MKTSVIILAMAVILGSCNSKKKEIKTEGIVEIPIEKPNAGEAGEDNGFTIHPVSHATMVLDWDGTIVYVDPVGDGDAFMGYTKPNIILVTDIHQDHFDPKTLQSVITDSVVIVAPKAVLEKMPLEMQVRTMVLDNGDKKMVKNISIEAIPMYNLREEAKQFHTKGRGNGYVLEKDGKRIYISGDTEDIPEMRNLKNIDIAFVCMNLPYTMTVEKAAEAVLAFKPKTVYPYHYRGQNGLSDVGKFKDLVNAGNPDIKVTQLNWYPEQ